MSTSDPDTLPSAAPSAGAQLRAARQAQGLHMAVLSAHLKVPVRQLEALEADAHAQLGAPAFVRALALAVCRQIKLDPAPVLAALPPVVSPLSKPVESIEPIAASVGHKPGWWGAAAVPRPVWGLAVLMVAAGAAFVWWPAAPLSPATTVSAPTAVGVPEAAPPVLAPALPSLPPPAVAPAPMPSPAPAAVPVPATAPSPAPAVAPAKPAESTPTAAGMRLRVSADMWVEVRDGQGQQPVKRLVKVGETVEIPAAGPLFVYLSKGDRAELSWQGKPVDLAPHAQNNEVRLRLQP